jgi:dUTP pyrophosphatase
MKIKRIGSHDLPLPSRASAHAAGYDLRTVEGYTLQGGERMTLGTGFAWEIPGGKVGLLCPRSGLAHKHGITIVNAPGNIDSDYRGEVKAILHNTGALAYTIEAGERIAQLTIVDYFSEELEEVEELSDTPRGEGGLGSTGKA